MVSTPPRLAALLLSGNRERTHAGSQVGATGSRTGLKDVLKLDMLDVYLKLLCQIRILAPPTLIQDFSTSRGRIFGSTSTFGAPPLGDLRSVLILIDLFYVPSDSMGTESWDAWSTESLVKRITAPFLALFGKTQT